ncbi:sporulation protein YpjB [Polycladomyces abyssicola]|uniref:Sporulation protein YpjB n=1 Tax=Polycladomyces abyssicola TaxID=1125966 RepID=A0A8D5UH47_9BACL|nr:sporulation protein YpjB [Polycladomyces abyssicola]BCU81820.1 sporulation protein YpjB [Polycladomyces abyssicola]
MWKRWIGLLVILWSSFFILHSYGSESAFAMEQTQPMQWARQAERVYQLVQRGDLLAARDALTVLSRSFSRANLSPLGLSVEQIRTLSQTLVEMEQELNRVRPNPTTLMAAALRMRMAFDALTHPNQPLWRQYYSVLQRDLTAIDRAINTGNQVRARMAVDALLNHYRLIRPAIVISRTPTTVTKVDSVLAFLRNQSRPTWNPALLRDGVSRLREMLNPLFYGPEEQVTAVYGEWDMPIVSFMLMVGGVIVSVLTYVGWKKYRAVHLP